MCYPKPGPRCANDLKKKLMRAVEKEKTDHSEDNARAVLELTQEFYATKPGIKLLKDKLAKTPKSKKPILEERIKAAEAHYDLTRQAWKNHCAGGGRISKLTEHALESEMKYDGDVPAWFNEEQEKFKKTWDTVPEIIDVVELPGIGKTAVIWEEESTSKRDYYIQKEDGIQCSRLVYRSFDTGKDVGSLTTTSVTNESIRKSFGDDEWTSLKTLHKRGGTRIFNYDYDFDYEETPDGDPFVNPILAAQTDEERIKAKREFRLRARSALNLHNAYGDDGPEDEETLDADLKELRDLADEEAVIRKRNFTFPHIDYSKIDDSVRGQGLGTSLYVYAGRKLAEKGLPLVSSSLQSDNAQSAWLKMSKSEKMPVKAMTREYRHSRKAAPTFNTTFMLDFR